MESLVLLLLLFTLMVESPRGCSSAFGQEASVAIPMGAQPADSSPSPPPPDPSLPPIPIVPTLWSDRADYAPGTLAQISGLGFQTNEVVIVQVLHADGTPSTGADHEPWSVETDSSGSIQSQWQVCTDDCVGSTLICTAVGQTSGRRAAVLFTDSSASSGLVSGSVWAWGAGESGQIGDGNYYSAAPSPIHVAAPAAWAGTKPVSIAAGGYQYVNSACYCTEYCYDSGGGWGGGYYYCCAQACNYYYYYYGHSLAVLDDGSVWAWGNGGYGQLGLNNYGSTAAPQPVIAPWASLGAHAIAVSAGNYHSVFLLDNGSVWATGYGFNGELGNGQSTQTALPVAVSAPPAWAGRKVVQIAAGDGHHCLAILDDGSVWAWGYNGYGQLGNGTTTTSYVPVPVTGPAAWTGKKAVSVAVGASHSLAVLDDGSVWGWGYNGNGELGNGTTQNSLLPVQVSAAAGWGGSKALTVSAGQLHSLVVRDDGTVWAWGYNGYGQLGNGTTADSVVPVSVSQPAAWSGHKAVTITACGYQSLVALTDGSAWGWGYNYRGALGNGGYGGVSMTPVAVSAPAAWAGQQVVALAAGEYHTLGVVGVVNQPPVVANPIADQSGTYGSSFSYTFPANTFTELESGETLSYTASGMPAGIGFNGSSRTFSGTPSAVGNYKITITATDNAAAPLSASTTFNLTVNPAVLTITANSTSKMYGQPLTFVGTEFGASGLVLGDTVTSISLTSLGTPATAQVSGSPYAIVPSGAVGTGLNNYTVSYINGALTLTPAPLSVTPDNKARAYGEPNPTFTGTIAGVQNGDNLTANFNTDASTATAVGTYAITAAITDPDHKLGNYSVTLNPGTLTIGKATLTVTADNQSKVYGAPVPSLSASYAGFANGETLATSGVTGAAALTTTAAQSSAVGAYPISISGGSLSSANYAFVFVNGTLAVTKAGLTIIADDQTKIYGKVLPTFTASYSGFVNGDTAASLASPASFTTIATAASSVGTYDITPQGASDANYTITFVTGHLTITPAVLTVAADNQSKLYGAALPSFTYQLSGFANGDNASVVSGAPTLNTTATVSSDVGAYAINVGAGSLSAQNYTFIGVAGTLTITPASLTITADGQSKVYGAALPSFTAGYAGFVLGQGPAVLGGTLGFTTAATQSSDVGNYSIMPGGLTSANYSVIFVSGTITITPACLKVTADNQTKIYGAANPPLTVSYSGFVLGQSASVLTGGLSLATPATGASHVGSYPIVPGGLTSANYAIIFRNGTLSVTPAGLTVTADDKSMIYGTPLPIFTASYAGFVNGDTPASLAMPVSFNTTASSASSVGPYAIVPAGAASPDYNITFLNGTLTVSPAALTITANDATKVFGQTLSFAGTEFSVTGLVNSDKVTGVALTSAGAAAGATVNGSPYPISVNSAVGSGLGNYDISYTGGQLTVTPAALTATANGPAIGYVLPVNSGLSFAGSFTPSGVTPYSATWTFSSADAAPITVTGSFGANNSITSPNVIFTGAGVYVVTLTVTDGAGTSGSGTMPAYVVIYNPSGGFVTGGGSLLSPAGAYMPNPNLTGIATFGFVSKYDKGATVPTGNTEFTFQAAGLSFHSSSYQWLVISGARAQYKGSGTLNGEAGYDFLLTAIDGQVTGGGGTDKLRMKIMDTSGNVIYDNQLGASDSSDPTTVIQGSIVMHK